MIAHEHRSLTSRVARNARGGKISDESDEGLAHFRTTAQDNGLRVASIHMERQDDAVSDNGALEWTDALQMRGDAISLLEVKLDE